MLRLVEKVSPYHKEQLKQCQEKRHGVQVTVED